MDDQPPWSNHKIEKKKKKIKEIEKKEKNQNKIKQSKTHMDLIFSFSKKSENFNIRSSYWFQLETTKEIKLNLK